MKHLGERLLDQLDARLTRGFLRLLPIPVGLFLVRLFALFLTPLGAMIWQSSFRQRPRPALFRLLGRGYRMALGHLTRRLWFYLPGGPAAAIRRTRVAGLEHLQGALRAGGGLVLASVHCFDFPLLQLWINRFDPDWRPYIVRGLAPDPTSFATPKEALRHGEQVRIFAGRLLQARNGARQIIRVLRDGGTVLIAQDERGKVEVPILGRRALLALGADRLAEITGARILPVIVSAVSGPSPWLIKFWPVIEPGDGRATEQLSLALRTMLEEYPEAWQRWRYLR